MGDPEAQLRRVATDEASLESAEAWRQWQRIEAAVQDMAPVLAHAVRLDAELRRSRRTPSALLRHLLTRRPRRARR